MKARIVIVQIVSFAVLSLILVTGLPRTTNAQTTNPEYLVHFPKSSRIKAEIKGADPIDTSARIIAAFDVLIEMVRKLSGERYRTNNNTPDEISLDSRYNSAQEPLLYKENSPSQADQPRWNQLRLTYRQDEAFRDELLKQFFPSEFRTFYLNTLAKQAAPASASRPATAGSATLTVASGFPTKPGVPNPLGGGPVVLLKGNAAPDLKQKQGVAEMKSRAAAEGLLDTNGKTTLSGLAPGNYYLMTISTKWRVPLTFGTPLVIKPGSNTVTIDERYIAMGDLDAASRDGLKSVVRELRGEEMCNATDILLNAECLARQREKQVLEQICPVKYTGPLKKSGPANASLSVIGMGYVYNYTERDRKTGTITNSKEVERGNFINTTLYLLDKNAEEVLKEAGVGKGLLGELGLPSSRIMMYDLLDVEDVAFPSEGTRKELSCVMDGIKSHAVTQMTTDANAKGTFPNVPAGTYYVFGRFYRGGKRPAGGMFWNYKIELKPGQNVLQLSVDKATLK